MTTKPGHSVSQDGCLAEVIAPAELPVGVLTALLGGPFFAWLLLRRPRAGGLA